MSGVNASSGSGPNPDPELIALATEVRQHAYAPYSRYTVGVALRTTDGSVHVGCNVEIAAYPLGSCAEAGAIAAMAAAGGRSIAEVVVVTGGDEPGTPCGGCRQRLREFAAPDVVVHSMTAGGRRCSMTIDALLPSSFGPEFLPPTKPE